MNSKKILDIQKRILVSIKGEKKTLTVMYSAADYLLIEEAANQLLDKKIIRLFKTDNGFQAMLRKNGLTRWNEARK